MNFDENQTLDARLKTLASELERTQKELRSLQRQNRRHSVSVKLAWIVAALIIVPVVSFALSSPAPQQNIITHFQAPFIVHDHAGKTIVEITDGTNGTYGVNVYNPHGGTGSVAFIGGTNNGNGKMQLGDSGGNSLVEAGILPGNIGVVRVYPMNGKSPIPIPNFIKGSAAGTK